MQRIFRTALVSSLLFPLVASAAGTGDLLKSLEGVNTQLQLDAESAAMTADDRALEESKELFPETGESRSSAGALEQVREERTSEFIVIRVDGKDVPLRDVKRMEWFAPYVRDVAERGLVSGYRDAAGVPTGLYGPGDNVTVEQLLKIAVMARRIDLSTCPPGKNVTASGSWSLPYVGCAEDKQWALYADGTVDVHRNATRAEVLITMMQAFDVAYAEAVEAPFTDVGLTLQFAGFIARAKADGIIAGYADENGMLTGMFGPTDPVTRAETAKIVSLALQVYAH